MTAANLLRMAECPTPGDRLGPVTVRFATADRVFVDIHPDLRALSPGVAVYVARSASDGFYFRRSDWGRVVRFLWTAAAPDVTTPT